MRNAGMLTTTRVSDGTAFGHFNISTGPALSSDVDGSPLDQYSFATVDSCFAFSSPRVLRSSSDARVRASVALPSVSSALIFCSRPTSALETRLSEAICSSDSFRSCLKRPTNFSSVSSASSSGKVTWTDAVSDVVVAVAGAVDAAGDGAVGATATFELFGPGVQLINRQARKARLTNRRVTMFGSF